MIAGVCSRLETFNDCSLRQHHCKLLLNVHFMSGVSEANPVQALTDICGEMRQVAESLRDTGPDPGVNDIPEIYETAASLLTTIITYKAGFDPNQNVLQKAAEFDAVLLQKEREFVKTMENNMNDLAMRIESLQGELNKRDSIFEGAVKEASSVFQSTLQRIQEKYEQKLQKLTEDLEAECVKKAEEETALKETFEQRLQERITEAETEWQRKVTEATNDVAEMQKQLQLAIHAKQEQAIRKNEELRELEKANAAEVEQEREVLNQMKESAEEELSKLQAQLDDLTEQANAEQQKSKKLTENLENQMRQERIELEAQFARELKQSEREVDELTQKLLQLQTELEMKKAEVTVRVREQQYYYEARLKQEQEKTQQMIADVVEGLNREYKPLIEELQTRIVKTERQKYRSKEDINRVSLTQAEGHETEIIDMNRKHQEERAQLRTDLRKQKHDLQAVLLERSGDIVNLEKELEDELKKIEQDFQDMEDEHERRVACLREALAEKQRQFDSIKDQKVTSYQQKRTSELTRLEAEHKDRLKELLFRMEQKLRIEAEKAYNDGVKQATAKQQQEVGIVKGRISDCKTQIEACQKRMTDVRGEHEQKRKEIEQAKLLELEHQKQKMREDFERDRLYFVDQKNKLMPKWNEANNRQHALEAAIDQAHRDIETMASNNPIESALDILRQSLSNMLARMKDEETSLFLDKAQKERALSDLKNTTDELREFADRTEKELEEFLDTKEARFEKVTSDEKAKWEKALADEEKRKADLENTRKTMREKYSKEIDGYTQQVAELKQKTQDDLDEIKQARAEDVKAFETEMSTNHDEAMEKLRSEHEKIMKALQDQREENRRKHEQAMAEIRLKYEEEAANAEMRFLAEKQELETEKAKLLAQREALKAKLEETAIPECEDCKERKQEIAKLREKRDQLQERCNELTKEALASDARMKALFPRKVNAKTSVTGSPRFIPQVTRPNSSMRRTIITPR